MPSSRDRAWFIAVLDPDCKNIFPSDLAQGRAEIIEKATRSAETTDVEKYIVATNDVVFEILSHAKAKETKSPKTRKNQNKKTTKTVKFL